MPGLNETSIYAALGLSAPEAQGANEQGVAAPADSSSNPAPAPEGANDQGVAAPETGAGAVDPNPAEYPFEEPAEPAAGTSPTQTPEERRVNAARRRQQEQQAAIDAAVSAARQEEQQRAADAMKNLFARAGMRNTFTGEPITSQEEFDAWQTRFRNEQLQSQLAKGELTVDDLNALVDDHPVVKQAREALTAAPQQSDTSQSSADPAPQQAPPQLTAEQQAADTARIQAELAEISKLDPTVKNLGDILNGPKGKEFYSYVQRGYSFLDAFRSANFDRLVEAKAQAARQQAGVNDRGKSHMSGAGNSRGSGALSVPAADLAMFRTFNPNATEADIQAYYNKYMKGR